MQTPIGRYQFNKNLYMCGSAKLTSSLLTSGCRRINIVLGPLHCAPHLTHDALVHLQAGRSRLPSCPPTVPLGKIMKKRRIEAKAVFLHLKSRRLRNRSQHRPKQMTRRRVLLAAHIHLKSKQNLDSLATSNDYVSMSIVRVLPTTAKANAR